MSSPKPQIQMRNTRNTNFTSEAGNNLQNSQEYLNENPVSQERLIQPLKYPSSNIDNAAADINSKDKGLKVTRWQDAYLQMKGKTYSKLGVDVLKVQAPRFQKDQAKQQQVSQSIQIEIPKQSPKGQKYDILKHLESMPSNVFDINRSKRSNNQLSVHEGVKNINNSFVNISTKSKYEQLYNEGLKASERAQKSKKASESSSSSDEEINFQLMHKPQPPKEVDKSNRNVLENKSLQAILKNSELYKNYLGRTGIKNKLTKKFSLDIPQLKQSSVPNPPESFFFKPQRVRFKKTADSQIRQGLYNQSQYLWKMNEERTCFFYQDLRSQQLTKKNGVKCKQLEFSKQDKMSPHVEYDHIYQRFYLFSNKEQKIWILSSLTMEQLCKVHVKKRVNDPNLHFCQINGRHFLFILGGYTNEEKYIAQGNSNIQIFEMNKWYLDMKSRVIKLIIGRINPILIVSKQSNNHTFLILGGNNLAKINPKGQFDFQYEKEINESTNMTGICINAKEIIELFQDQQHTTISNISVKIEDPFRLHSGLVLALNNWQWLILPNSLALFQVKIFKKEVNIIEATSEFFTQYVSSYQKREICLKSDKQRPIIFTIDDRGIMHITASKGRQKQRYCCNIY